MNYVWLLGVFLSVNLLAWICVASWVNDLRADAFRAGLVMGRELNDQLLDRIMRDAGIDPSTLPGRP